MAEMDMNAFYAGIEARSMANTALAANHQDFMTQSNTMAKAITDDIASKGELSMAASSASKKQVDKIAQALTGNG